MAEKLLLDSAEVAEGVVAKVTPYCPCFRWSACALCVRTCSLNTYTGKYSLVGNTVCLCVEKIAVSLEQAIRDGVIDAVIDHEGGCIRSRVCVNALR